MVRAAADRPHVSVMFGTAVGSAAHRAMGAPGERSREWPVRFVRMERRTTNGHWTRNITGLAAIHGYAVGELDALRWERIDFARASGRRAPRAPAHGHRDGTSRLNGSLALTRRAAENHPKQRPSSPSASQQQSLLQGRLMSDRSDKVWSVGVRFARSHTVECWRSWSSRSRMETSS